MIICNNSLMNENGHPVPCADGKLCCCRYCDKVKECLKNTPKDGVLCPYINCEQDIAIKCSFEKTI